MKKTCKILSGSLLVALMAFGLVKGNPVEKTGGLQVRDVLAEDVTKDVAGRIIRKADVDAPVATGKISEAKAQVSEEVEGKRHIRFVVGVDSYAYDAAHFNITFKNGEEVVKTWADQRVSYVYEAVEAAGETLAAADVFGEGYNYLIAFTVNNVPQANWNNTIEVNATVETAEQEYAGTVATKSVQEIIDAEEVVVPEPELTVVHKELTFSSVWNPHGNIFLAVGWSNGELNNDMIDVYNIVAEKDGVTHPFAFNRIDGTMAVIIQNSTLTGIETANYTLKMELTTKPINNVVTVYYGEVEIVKGQKYTVAKAKTDYTKNLNNYLADNNLSEINYTEENWALVQGYINTGLEAINAAASINDVKTAYNNAVALIAEVEQRDLSLDETISQAKEQLTAHAATKKQADYSEENWTLIQNLVVEGHAAIEAADSAEAIEAALNSYKGKIDAVEVNMIALKNGNFNPHGDGFIVIGWTNSGLTNDTVVDYYGAVIVDGVEYPMEVKHNDGAMAKFFRSAELGGAVETADYLLVIKLTTSDGTVYGNTFTVSGRKIIGAALS